MSVDSVAATRWSGSDSDLSSYSFLSGLDDNDSTNNHHSRKVRMAGKKTKVQSKTKVKPPKANQKFNIEDEIFMMEEVLSLSSSENSLNVVEDGKEDSFEEISPVLTPVCSSMEDSTEVVLKRKSKDHLEGSRLRDISIVNIVGLLLVLSSFSWITAMFGPQFLSKTDMIVANENVISELADGFKFNNTLSGISLTSDKNITFQMKDEPMVVILPPADVVDANVTKVIESKDVKPHFHNVGNVTFGPMTYKDYLNKQKIKLEEMKTSSNRMSENSESLSKTVSDLLKKGESGCDNKFECCNIGQKRFGLSKRNERIVKRKGQISSIKKSNILADPTVRLEQNKSAIEDEDPKPMQSLKLDFNTNKIDDIINNFSRYIKKNALSTRKEKKFNRMLPRPAKIDQALHNIAKDGNVFKQCMVKNKPSTLKNKIKSSFFVRIATCMVLDIVAIITLRKLGIAIIGRLKSLMRKPADSRLELTAFKQEVSAIKRANMFQTLPFHHTKARVIKKPTVCNKFDKAMISAKRNLIDQSPKMDYASDYYMLMLSLKMKALHQNVKSKVDDSVFRRGLKRYSVEFKQKLIRQLSGIYKHFIKNEKLRHDLVFCIMKIYECKFEYAPTFANHATSEAFDRLDKFKTLLIDYFRHLDDPQVNTKYLKSTSAKQREDLELILELLLQDLTLGTERCGAEGNFIADDSLFRYDGVARQPQSAVVQKPPTITQSSGSMLMAAGTSSAHSINDPAYYMRERFSLLAKFWKLKQTYFTKRIQICNMLKDKLSDASIGEREGATILDGIINSVILGAKVTGNLNNPEKFEHPEGLITSLVDTLYKTFDNRRMKDDDKTEQNLPLAKKMWRVNNELYRELFEKKAQAIQEKDLSRGKTPLLLAGKTSDFNATRLKFVKPYQVDRDSKFHKML